MKILVIEDEKLLAQSLKPLLESKGFQVEVAGDGETGAEYAELGIYDLLILDVMMPGLNGFWVARRVRAKRCRTPILMLTARASVEERIRGLNAGADYYLTKPFDSRELLACINALLRRQGKQADELVFGFPPGNLMSCGFCCRPRIGSCPKKPFWPGSGVMIPMPCRIMWRFMWASCEKTEIHRIQCANRSDPAAGLPSGGGGNLIRKLRIKFLCINMAIVTAMLA